MEPGVKCSHAAARDADRQTDRQAVKQAERQLVGMQGRQECTDACIQARRKAKGGMLLRMTCETKARKVGWGGVGWGGQLKSRVVGIPS